MDRKLTWVDWAKQVEACTTHMQVTKMAVQVFQAGMANAALSALIEKRHAEISTAGARVVRVHVLREVRNTVAKAVRDAPLAHAYYWAAVYPVVDYLSWKLGEARRAAGLEPPRG